MATLFAFCVLVAGMVTATPVSANQSVTVQAQQTDWYVNDDPVLFGPSEYWYSGQAGQGYGSNNFKFTYALRSDTADNWAHWYMGRRVGRQQVSVYVPHADATATVVYEVTADNGLFSLARLNQANASGWTTLGTWDFNGGDVVIVAADNDASPAGSKIGVDAIAMRCVANCGAQLDVPAVPSAVQYNSGTLFWNAVTGATSYDIIVWKDSGSTIIHGVECCAYLFLSEVLRTAERISVRAANSAGRSEWAPAVSVRRRVEAPAVPSGLRFSSGRFTWDSVSGATSYDVRVCTHEGCVTHNQISCCGWTFGEGPFNSIRVRAVNSAGRSDWSVRIDGPELQPPSVPSGVGFSSGRPIWNSVSDATSYELENWLTEGSSVFYRNLTCTTRCSLWTELDEGWIRVRAGNDAGWSPWSAWVEVPAAVPETPSGLRFSSGVASWNSVSGATSYNVGLCVFEGNVNGCVVEVDVACCSWRISDTSVTHVRVQAVNSAGSSAWSSDVQVRHPQTVPETPSGLRFSSGVASWNSVSGATSYNVGLCVFEGNVNGCVVEVDVACCSWRISDTSVTHVRVQAVNSAGGSAWSSDVQVRQPQQAPGQVTGQGIRVGEFGPELFWRPVQGATSYDIDARETGNDLSSYRRGIACGGNTCGYLYREDRHTTQAFREGTAFRVRAVNNVGAGPWSSWVTAATTGPPGEVQGIEHRSGTVRWEPLAGATSYEVNAKWRSGGKGRSGIRCSSQCSYSLQRRQDSSVMVRVRAENHAGRGPWSAWIEIPPIVPRLRGEPTIWGFDIHDHFLHFGANDVTIKWKSVSNATSYKVETRYRSLHGSIPKFGGSPKQITDSILTWINKLSECSSVGNRTPCYSIDSRGSATVRGKTEYRKPDVADNDEDRDSILEFRVTAYGDAGDDSPSKWTPLRDQRIRSEVDMPGCAVLKGIEYGSKAYDVISILAALYSGGVSVAILQGLKIAAYPNVTAGAKMLLDCYSDPVDALKDIHPLIGKYLEIIGLDKIVSCVTASNSFIAETDPTFGDWEADSEWITAARNRVSDRC